MKNTNLSTSRVQFIGLFLALSIFGCELSEEKKHGSAYAHFEVQRLGRTNVGFVNKMDLDSLRGHYYYINVFNGGGVALGDVNNDGLEDIYLTGNQVGNKLYINKGNFVFEDITKKAGVEASNKWSNSAVITDMNNDGWGDIYVCHAFHDSKSRRSNSLYLNMQDGTFKEVGSYVGIADEGFSICASFFDYDLDGDNDLFVGNHGTKRGFINPQEHIDNWLSPPGMTTDRLYRNDGNMKFTDVTEVSGILNYGWTLSTITADFNDDGWPDIYVGVDHEIPDKLYINQKDGTFKDEVKSRFGHLSFSCMGIDLGDINNDGLQDLFAVDMLSKDNYLEKSEMGSMNVEAATNLLNKGMHAQHMRNSLQLNRGKGNFSEIGQLVNIERTEWSWATLFLDVDNSGHDDIFITNGYYKGIMSKDWRKKFKKAILNVDNEIEYQKVYSKHIKALKSSPYKNELYINHGNLSFTNQADEYNLGFSGFSSGAAYADLDNDGDLDLVVSNIDTLTSIYENKSVNEGEVVNNFISFKLGEYINSDPQGAKIKVLLEDGSVKSRFFISARGYISSVGDLVHFGLGDQTKIDRVEVFWPNGEVDNYTSLEVNRIHKLIYNKGSKESFAEINDESLFFENELHILNKHKEDIFDDYENQILLPHKLSQFGPIMSKGDLNGDGLEDLFIGGSSNYPGEVYYQSEEGTLIKQKQNELERDKRYEDLGSVFFDADLDGDLDLYVSSGGNQFKEGHDHYQNRLYLNINGNFKRADYNLPDINISTGRVAAGDFDSDGDVDLFVCGKMVPHKYPLPATSYLLKNDAKGVFEKFGSTWDGLGLCSDAVFSDIDLDNDLDLILVGDWMSIRIFHQDGGAFVESTKEYGLESEIGWWNKIHAEDMDADGRDDYIVGNLGDNYKYKATDEKPFHVFANDFDDNGTYDIALGYYLGGSTLFPVRGKQCSSEQVPDIGKKYDTYDDYGNASIFEVYGERLDSALHYEANQFSHVFIDNKKEGLKLKNLPKMSQLSPIFGIAVNDYNKDGNKDILMAGNLFVAEIETGQADAGMGVFLAGNGKNEFDFVPNIKSGFLANGDVRDIIDLKNKNGGLVIVGVNNGIFTFYKY